MCSAIPDTFLHRSIWCGAVLSLPLILSVVAAGQDRRVVSDIEATISTVGGPHGGSIEVVLGGPLLNGREPLKIRAGFNPDQYPADLVAFGDPWGMLDQFLGHLEFYRGATLLHRVEDYHVGIYGVSRTSSGILDVHYFTWGGGAPVPSSSGILRLWPYGRRRYVEVLLCGP